MTECDHLKLQIQKKWINQYLGFVSFTSTAHKHVLVDSFRHHARDICP